MTKAIYLKDLLDEILQDGGYVTESTSKSSLFYYRKYPEVGVNLQLSDNSIIMRAEVTNSGLGQPTDIDQVLSILKIYSTWTGAFIDSVETIRAYEYSASATRAVIYERELWSDVYEKMERETLLAMLGYQLLSCILLRERFIDAVRACWDVKLNKLDSRYVHSPVCNTADILIDSIAFGIGVLKNRITNTHVAMRDEVIYIPVVGSSNTPSASNRKIILSQSFSEGIGKSILEDLNRLISKTGYVATFELVDHRDHPELFEVIHRIECAAVTGDELITMSKARMFTVLALTPITQFSIFPVNVASALAVAGVLLCQYQSDINGQGLLEEVARGSFPVQLFDDFIQTSNMLS